MPQEAKSAQPPHAPAAEGSSLHGWTPDLADPAAAMDAFDKAFDYRGDVTLTLADGSALTGYIFDRRRGATLRDSYVRLIPEGADEPRRVPYADVRRLTFSGRDTAQGKSFETWVKKYVEKKLKGEAASIESEAL